MQQVFDYAIDPSRRRSRNGKKIGRPRNEGRQHHVEHTRRPEISPRHPVHVTLRLRPGLRSLRHDAEFAAIVRALSEAKGRFGMGVTDFSVLHDHLHLIVELDPGASDAPGKDLPPDRAAKLVRRLSNTDGFWGPVGVRTLSRESVFFHQAPRVLLYDPRRGEPGPVSNWTGPVWVLSSYYLARGLERYGEHIEAVHAHPARAVGLLYVAAGRELRAPVEYPDVVETEETSLEYVPALPVLSVDPPGEVKE